ncbi:MAG: hypothetical protein ACE5D4_08770 [Thermodesulfobacteriota bacterium]
MILNEDGEVADIFAMPGTEKDIGDLFRRIANYPNLTAIIEKVHSFSGQGIKSCWTFSGNYHGLRMAMVCNKIPFDEVQPLKWQQALGIPKRSKTETKTQHKNKLKAKAQCLFPDQNITLKTADALLIAEFLRRKEQYHNDQS